MKSNRNFVINLKDPSSINRLHPFMKRFLDKTLQDKNQNDIPDIFEQVMKKMSPQQKARFEKQIREAVKQWETKGKFELNETEIMTQVRADKQDLTDKGERWGLRIVVGIILISAYLHWLA